MRIVFAGVTDFSAAIFKVILASEHKVVALITQPDKTSSRGRKIILSRCKKIALEIQKQNKIKIIQPSDINDKENITIVREMKPDLIVVSSYGQLIGEELLNLPKYGSINTHTSLLPKYRGASPIQSAILNAEKETGVSIMKIEKLLDSGPIACMEKIKINRDETSKTLELKLINIAKKIVIQSIDKIESGEIKYTQQNHKIATYCSKIKKENARLNFAQSAELLDRKIRAFNPEPISFCNLNLPNKTQIIRIHQAKTISQKEFTDLNFARGSKLEKGALIWNKKRLFVCMQNSKNYEYLEIIKLQLPGKNTILAREFIGSTLQSLNQNPIQLVFLN